MTFARFKPHNVISPLRSSVDVHQLNLRWLIRLRWVAIIGQTAVVLAARLFFDINFPYAILFSIILVETLSNIGLVAWARQHTVDREAILGIVLVADVFFLTCLLYWSGGSFNPFSLLLFIHIGLAALVLRAFWTWMIALLCMVCYGILVFEYSPQQLEWTGRQGAWDVEIQGMWVAFAVTAGVLAFFINKIQRALIVRDAEIVRIREAQMRHEKLASLATLAAGAAHEFSTPLSTIAVVAGELQRSLERAGADEALLEDAALIRDQVARCRTILQQMSADAGESMGEVACPITAEELVARTLDGVPHPERVVTRITPPAHAVINVPPGALAQALRGLVNNALDATPDNQPVEVYARNAAHELVFEVRDRGTGMSDGVLSRVGEPFFTTKAPGRGMGLGIFLARSLVDKIGGRLVIESQPGQGTTVTVHLPRVQEPDHDRQPS